MAIAILLGLVVAIGVFLVIYGIKPVKLTGPTNPFSINLNIPNKLTSKNYLKELKTSRAVQFKVLLALLLPVIFYLGTSWIVMIPFGLFVGWILPDITNTFSTRKKAVVQVEAYELWTAQLANLINTGNHILNAIVLSQGAVTEEIREDVRLLSIEAEIVGVLAALDNFALRARSPYADQVVLGLKVAYESGTKVAEVLEEVSRVFKTETQILKRAESSRKLANSQIFLSLGVSFTLSVLLILINRGYLEPFDSVVGQMVLAVVLVMYSSALIIVKRFTIVAIRPRLIIDQSYLEDDKDYMKEQKKLQKEEKKVEKKAKRLERKGMVLETGEEETEKTETEQELEVAT